MSNKRNIIRLKSVTKDIIRVDITSSQEVDELRNVSIKSCEFYTKFHLVHTMTKFKLS